ncbi:hypothetical protein P8452_34255 [Trifolium repens]|nr:hypothetical protein P8452_34255 [Trifolium repens]
MSHPTTPKHQRQSYADDLVKHHQRFGGKVDAWKAALTQVAGLSGWDSHVTRPESTLVTEIVKDIAKKLKCCVSSDYEGMTGIDNHIESIQSLLLLESPTVRIIGIWGMGGIGKTTITNAIFEKLATQFSSKSIIRNVQQEIERVGLSHVKKEYLSQLLDERIKSSESNSYDQRLKRTKVLLVFDDVKDADQLKDLIGTHHKFGQGSRIIVTSRDRQVLENSNAHEIYQVREMDDQDSLQLFCLFAFKQNHPKESFVSLTEKVLDYAKGLPLALKVLGSMLYGKANEVWESQLQKLEKLPDHEIFRLLKLSYDGLDDEQKNIFLDIACFHIGELEKVVAQMLDCCGFSTRIGLDVLEDRCLISISEGEVWMHDLIRDMGRQIVMLQCVDNPGKRSRLWKASEIDDVLSKGKGTDAIRCIFLNMDEIWEKKVQLHVDTFKKMHNLRMIKFHNPFTINKSNVTFHGFLKSFPNDLKFLQWDGYPQRSLPQDFCPENLVTLDMSYSHLEQFWKGDQALPSLKRLDLSYSKKLIAVPDLSFTPNIEEVILSGCVSLTQVYSSGFLNNLNFLLLEGCTELKSLNIRSNILSRSSGLVALRDCHKLETLLISSRIDHVVQSYKKFYGYSKVGDMHKLCDEMEIKIELNDEGDYEICGSFSDTLSGKRINDFCWLDISKCESLSCLPAELLNLKFLTGLSLRGCLKLELPEIKETMENLKVLILDETSIKELPSSLYNLVGLEKLSLQSCTKLKTIPSSIGNFGKLKLNLTYCESLETFPSSIFKLKLAKLNLEGCSMLATFPEILEPAESFTCIDLTDTAIKELPSSLHHLVGLKELSLQSCTKLKTIPSSIGNLSKLLKLKLAYCESLETFPSSIFKLKLTKLDFQGCSMFRTFPEIPNDIGRLSSLTELSLKGSSIVNLPESLAHLSSLKSLNLSDCKLLESVPKFPPNLKKVFAFDCPSIKRMVLNSRSDYEEDTFKFHLTNSQELDATSLRNIEEEAYIKINDDAYRSVIFCFPGSAVPDWFPHRCQGHSITIRNDDLNLYGRNRLIGFALCVVLGDDFPYKFFCLNPRVPYYYGVGFRYKLKFESDGQTYFHPDNKLEVEYYDWKDRYRIFAQHHTFLWKYELDLPRIDVETITFEIVDEHRRPLSFPTTMTVKECGICPLYIKEPSGDAVCSVDPSSSDNYTQ